VRDALERAGARLRHMLLCECCWYAHPLTGVLPRAAENRISLDSLGLVLLFAVGIDDLPVSGAVQWYRADTRSTAGTDLLLADRAGSGTDLQAQLPGVPAVVESAINGWPVLHFDGVDDRMLICSAREISLSACPGLARGTCLHCELSSA
jgi:hypothetical protein